MISRKYNALAAVMLSAILAASCVAAPDNKETEAESSTEAASEVTTTQSETSDINTPHAQVMTSETVPEEDTTAPMWLEAPDSLNIEADSEFVVGDYLSYIDDLDSTVDMTVDGEVDTSVTGSYPITVTLTDDAGNKTTKDINVTVYVPAEPTGETEPGPEPEPDYYEFDVFMADYAGEGAMYGIDISKYQGDVDFEKVKAAGCNFVILRAMVYYKGELIIDEKFSQNLANAKAAGLKVGVYIYTFANTEELVREQTDALCELLDGEQLDFPVVFDWERFSNFQQYNLSMADLRQLYQVFKDELSKYGYEGMLYSSKYYLEAIWKPDAGETVWLAHYTDQTSYEGEYIMWQTSSYGTIDGIDGPVDMDLYYGG